MIPPINGHSVSNFPISCSSPSSVIKMLVDDSPLAKLCIYTVTGWWFQWWVAFPQYLAKGSPWLSVWFSVNDSIYFQCKFVHSFLMCVLSKPHFFGVPLQSYKSIIWKSINNTIVFRQGAGLWTGRPYFVFILLVLPFC